MKNRLCDAAKLNESISVGDGLRISRTVYTHVLHTLCYICTRAVGDTAPTNCVGILNLCCRAGGHDPAATFPPYHS